MPKSSAKSVVELATGPESLIHPATPDDADSMALAIKGTEFIQIFHFFKSSSDLLDKSAMNDTFSIRNVYLNLLQANGQPEKMFPLELGRAQGYLQAYCQLRY